MSVGTDIITAAEFEAMDLPESCEWELHDGTVISLTFPDSIHTHVQRRLTKLLEDAFASSPDEMLVFIELPYRIGVRHDHRADVAVIAALQSRESLSAGRILGCPKLAIEILSRSKRPYKLEELEELVLGNGGVAFWRADPKRRMVTAAVARDSGDRVTREYGPDDSIPLEMLGLSSSIAVRDILEGIVL